MTSGGSSAPDWDIEQLEVIIEAPSSWQLVAAGPGAGKSAVACQRVAYLLDEGVPPTRILLISFTRTAVAEIRDRIVSYAVAGARARNVRISTIDSHAWNLRIGFDDAPIVKVVGENVYDLSIARAVELFRERQPDLCDFMGRLEHLIIDEAQDVMSTRADLIIEILHSLAENCGVTILADPAQAIYGFTTSDEAESSLLARLEMECPRPLLSRTLKQIHRIKDLRLVDVFLRTRREIELAENVTGHVNRIQQTIRETCGRDVGATSYKNLADLLTGYKDGSMLVLFRGRADVLMASSHCSEAGIEHRLRMSDAPVVVRPWLGWLFGEFTHSIASRDEFSKLWEARSSRALAPLAGEQCDDCWSILHRLAAGARSNTIDLVLLRGIIARGRPPIELCYPEIGTAGPILGTIHASKGREADTVVLVMPRQNERENDPDSFEEGRVYYVGATRARKTLIAASNGGTGFERLKSKRVYRPLEPTRVQLEVGRNGDIDRATHLGWSSCLKVQDALASCVGRAVPVAARALAEDNYALRIVLQQKVDGVTSFVDVAQMSEAFWRDLRNLWSEIDREGRLRPPMKIPHLYLVAVTTVGLSDAERAFVKPPYNQSGLALAPVVKGFPMIQFCARSARKYHQ